MLQQVLQQMYIDPELLEGLTELEKETLFCYMRAEQIRRWNIWDAEETSKVNKMKSQNRPLRKGGKSVQWLLDDTGEVVVDEIQSLRFDDFEENDELQMNDVRISTSETDSCSGPITTINEVKIMNNDELPEVDKCNQTNSDARLSNAANALKRSDSTTNKNCPELETSTEEIAAIDMKDIKNSVCGNRLIFLEQRSVLRELSSNEVRKVAKQVAEWETRTSQNVSKPTSEVPRRIKPTVKTACNNEPVDETDELRWRAQLRKANEVEARIRNIARLAREEHRRSLIENGNEPFPIFTTPDSTKTLPVICKSNKWMQLDEKDVSKL